MKRKAYFIFIILLVVVAGYSIWRSEHLVEPTAESFLFGADSLNASYFVDGEVITFVDGRHEREIIAGSSLRETIQVFGVPVAGDLNGDGIEDMAVLLVKNSGGSGTFYYVAVAIQEVGGWRGTNALLLGDRVAPQNVEIRNGVVIANYAERAPGESFADRPSVGVSKYSIFENGVLKEILKPDLN